MIYKHTKTGESKTRRGWQNSLGISFHPDNPPNYLIHTPSNTIETPEQVLFSQQNEVRMAAEQSYREPVTDPDGVTWNGGFDSAQAIKAAADMAEFAGLTTLSIYDSSNVEHVVTIDQAKMVAAGIGAAYQTKFAAKQAAMRALSAVDLTGTDAVDQLSSISFADFLPAEPETT